MKILFPYAQNSWVWSPQYHKHLESTVLVFLLTQSLSMFDCPDFSTLFSNSDMLSFTHFYSWGFPWTFHSTYCLSIPELQSACSSAFLIIELLFHSLYWLSWFKKFLHFFMYMLHTACILRTEDDLWELFFFFHHVSCSNQTQVVRYDDKYSYLILGWLPYQLSHFIQLSSVCLFSCFLRIYSGICAFLVC